MFTVRGRPTLVGGLAAAPARAAIGRASGSASCAWSAIWAAPSDRSCAARTTCRGGDGAVHRRCSARAAGTARCADVAAGERRDARARGARRARRKFDRSEHRRARLSPICRRPSEFDEFVRTRRPQRTSAGASLRDAPAASVRARARRALRLLRKEWAAQRGGAARRPIRRRWRSFTTWCPSCIARGMRARGPHCGSKAQGAIAADLVVRDGDRRVQLLRGADPEHLPAGAPSSSPGLARGGVGGGRAPLRVRRRRGAAADGAHPGRCALRLWNTTTAARLHRGVTALRAPRVTLARRQGGAQSARRGRSTSCATSAPDVVQRAVARVATYSTLHLYRGELFTRNVRETGDLTLALVHPRGLRGALAAGARAVRHRPARSAASYCRQKWDRGDTVVLAEVAGKPAGIVWCARARGVRARHRARGAARRRRVLHPRRYVHPDERGRQVAPAMLDFLARELRARDVYRAWALIERTNTASTRAFEKAAYASVADVVYARMGLASRLIVRPPDPEARAFLGLTVAPRLEHRVQDARTSRRLSHARRPDVQRAAHYSTSDVMRRWRAWSRGSAATCSAPTWRPRPNRRGHRARVRRDRHHHPQGRQARARRPGVAAAWSSAGARGYRAPRHRRPRQDRRRRQGARPRSRSATAPSSAPTRWSSTTSARRRGGRHSGASNRAQAEGSGRAG